ncbi:hypothetical protein ABW286_14005 [Erwinia papayae]|uniref:Phage protein n=1 Tax=Erwinia papayae TaxID=206499 RepID=A0ABV3N3A5_9GAMM
MSLKFELGSISKGIRSFDGNISFEESALILLGECIETLEVRVTITGIPQTENGKANFSFDYFEKYDPHSTFENFSNKAISFAKSYCANMGMAGKATIQAAQ